jgi:phosphate transport system protein
MCPTMTVTEHTTKAFDADLQELTRMVAEMGGLAEKQVCEAIEALTRRDGERARWVIAADAAVDAMQRAIEERAVSIIARWQPMAVDLRAIVGILRIAGQLERIGDLAKNIGKRIPAIHGDYRPPRAMRGVSHMAMLLLGQLRQVLDSFIHRDVGKATEVWRRDDQLDLLYTSLFRELLTYMMEDPAAITFGIHLLFCTKNLERMGDHATNIAEAVAYMVTGRPLIEERPKADITSSIALAPAH